jgi:hypothetical protein
MLNYYSKLWWSAIADPDEYSTIDSGYLNVTEPGGAITGIKGLDDYFFVFQESVYTVYQKNLGDVPFSKLLARQYGCHSDKTIQDINSTLFYLSSTGDIRVTNGITDNSISAGIKEITRDIINGRNNSDYYSGSANAMPSAVYDRYNNAYRLYYAGASTSCDKCLTYFIDKGIWTTCDTQNVLTGCPVTDTSNEIAVVGNSDASGVTYTMQSKYSDVNAEGTIDLGWIASGAPNKDIKLQQLKLWVHADAGEAVADNCNCTITATVYNDPSSLTSYTSESNTLAYNGVRDNLQEIEFNNIQCTSHYVRIVLTDSGTNRNYSISKILISYETMASTQ